MTKIKIIDEDQEKIQEEISLLESDIDDLESDKTQLEQDLMDSNDERDNFENELEEEKTKNENLEETKARLVEAMKDVKNFINKKYFDKKEIPFYLEEVNDNIDYAFKAIDFTEIRCVRCKRVVGWSESMIYKKEEFCSKDCKQITRLKE